MYLQNSDPMTKPEMVYPLSLLNNTQETNGDKSDYSFGAICGHSTSFYVLITWKMENTKQKLYL